MKVTKGSGDFGIDITARYHNRIYGIQCNNMVYVKEFYSYPFLYNFKNSRTAYKCYDDMINRCYEYSHGKLSVFREINIQGRKVLRYYFVKCKVTVVK